MPTASPLWNMVRHMTAQGAHRLGFVGDPKHCNSFQERWIAFNYALQQIGLTADPALSICDPDDSPYGDTAWIRGRLEARRVRCITADAQWCRGLQMWITPRTMIYGGGEMKTLAT